MTADLLIEIGCEEIPARMIPGAAAALRERVTALLDHAGITHGESIGWGGTRRLAVRVDAVASAQAAREELVLGPPAAAAFGADGAPTVAAKGFAKKQGIDPAALERVDTDKGAYAGVRRSTGGRTLDAILSGALEQAVSSMPFPKTMRWGDGSHRWVRPVHWVVVLHGARIVPLEIFDLPSGRLSRGHRFLANGPVEIPAAADYERVLEAAFVLVSPERRRLRLRELLEGAAAAGDCVLAPDDALLEEIVDLVEWPGVVRGSFDPAFQDLPAEILVTTLRHHQKSFSVRTADGPLAPGFLSVANTDRDPAGHIRRGNEWVVSGRLEDARFFWNEDRKRPLADRVEDLGRVDYHAKMGSYRDKTARIEALSCALCDEIGLPPHEREAVAAAARLSKADLVTGLVGEFPELQGIVGGLLLEAEGGDAAVARAVSEHYRPQGGGDAIPESTAGCIVALADKLDAVSGMLAAGEAPTGSRDPFGLRRASSGIFRIALERGLSLSLDRLVAIAGGGEELRVFLTERFENYLRDTGSSANEVAAVLKGTQKAASGWPLASVKARLDAIAAIRDREDFAHLVDLVKRVANIRRKNAPLVAAADAGAGGREHDPESSVEDLARMIEDLAPRIDAAAGLEEFGGVVDLLARFVGPVDTFFQKALVVNADDTAATHRRLRVLGRLEEILTRHFDLRELPGQADRRS